MRCISYIVYFRVITIYFGFTGEKSKKKRSLAQWPQCSVDFLSPNTSGTTTKGSKIWMPCTSFQDVTEPNPNQILVTSSEVAAREGPSRREPRASPPGGPPWWTHRLLGPSPSRRGGQCSVRNRSPGAKGFSAAN